ncbi:MAG: hypothetical protein EKK53_22065 [Burkholderiales bacterium]|nr:MAG: hypothetical protein EKK53_22065 [Burkholderiales bacterium]
MSIRGLIIGLVLLGVVGALWQQRERLQSWVASAKLPMPSGSNSSPASTAAPKAAGGGELRKCVKNGQVTYANVDCPAGSQAQAVTGGTVTVMPGTPVATPASSASGPSSLHKALDVTRDDGLRDKIMQRQIEGAR